MPIVASVPGAARPIEVGEREAPSPEKKEDKKMPNFILATAALLLRRPFPPPATIGSPDAVHEAMHARTRAREATRRLRASRIHEPYVDLGPLDLSNRRH